MIEVALREKYLVGNQNFLILKPFNRSSAMARMQNKDANEMQIPINTIGELYVPSVSELYSQLSNFSTFSQKFLTELASRLVKLDE